MSLALPSPGYHATSPGTGVVHVTTFTAKLTPTKSPPVSDEVSSNCSLITSPTDTEILFRAAVPPVPEAKSKGDDRLELVAEMSPWETTIPLMSMLQRLLRPMSLASQ